MAQTQKKQQDMGTGDVKKLLLQLMIPAVVAQVVNLLYTSWTASISATSRGSARRL